MRTRQILLYNLAVYVLFVLAYWLSGFDDDNFVRPTADQDVDDAKARFAQCLYFAWITHTTVGYGDFYPTSGRARSLVAAHAACVWAQVLIFSS